MTTKIIHNCETNEIKEITMTAKEMAEIKAAHEEHEAAKAEAKAAKQAALDKLGITAEELAAALS
jgi:hypothetical protein